MLRRLIFNRKCWLLLGLLTVGLAAFPYDGHPVSWLFPGDPEEQQTKQLFLFLALAALAACMYPLAKSRVNLLHPFRSGWAISLFIAGALVTYADIWDVPHFLQTNPGAASAVLAAVVLGPALLGALYVAQRPPKKHDGKFGSHFNNPSTGV